MPVARKHVWRVSVDAMVCVYMDAFVCTGSFEHFSSSEEEVANSQDLLVREW